MDLIKPGRVIDFMGQRRFWITLSIVLVVISAVLLWKPGPRFGIDFNGGTELTVEFDRQVDLGAVRTALGRLGDQNAEVVASTTRRNTVIIRIDRSSTLSQTQIVGLRRGTRERLGATPLRDFRVSPGGDSVVLELGADRPGTEIANFVREAGAALTPRVSVRGTEALRLGNAEEHRWQVGLMGIADETFAGLQRELNTTGHLSGTVWVSAKAGSELRDQALRAVFYSIVFIMIYVAFRFDLRFAPGGILGLFHDAMVTLGFFVLTRREVSISTVAAILTVIGYSMNDTVIVYDRIRENLANKRGLRMLDVINHSVSEMFSRTIVTSTTVILSMVPFTIWGTGVINNFAWALIVGVLAGTYSSIYVAAPLTEWIDSRFFHPGGEPTRAGSDKDDGDDKGSPGGKSARKGQPKEEDEESDEGEPEGSPA